MFNDASGEAVAAYVPLVMDTSGKYAFSPDSLPAAYTYDTSGAPLTETRGPDHRGLSFTKTYTFTNGVLMGESAWVKQ